MAGFGHLGPWARGQNLGQVFFFIESFVFEKQLLFQADFLSVTLDHDLGWG